MSDLTNLEYTPGTPWSKAHDPKGNMVAIDTAISAGATNAGDIATNAADISTNASDIATLSDEVDTGVVGQARLIFTDQPSIGDTIGIGADTYEFDGVAANINVPIGLDAAETQASLIDAINTSGTENVLAAADSVTATTIVIYNADAPGGTATVGTQSLVLAESITHINDVWDLANLNDSGRDRFSYRASGNLTIDATNVATPVFWELPFTPTEVEWYAKDAAGAILHACTATLTIVSGQLKLDAAAGGTPLVATDVVYWVARG